MATRDFAQTKDGLKIRYEIRGSGDPLALIMGFSGSGRGWGEPFLAGIDKHFRTVVIDNRGTGESDKPDREWTVTDMANDVAAVLDHAGIARAHVYGISMGGMIAQEFAIVHGPRVNGLVLGCTNCGMSHSAPANPEAIGKLMPEPGIPPEEQARRAFSVACGRAFLASQSGQRFIDQQLAEMANYPITPMHTYMRQAGAIQGWDSHARLGDIKARTLIISGDDDALIPVANAEILKSAIRGSSVHIIKGAGHMFFWEAPEEAVRVPAQFLKAA